MSDFARLPQSLSGHSASPVGAGQTHQPRRRVGIVIPCHNYGTYLREAVESVLGQNYRDWELIIVNDGSTDCSVSEAKRLIAENPQAPITLIEQDRQGLSIARNTGISRCATEYILPLDADDKLHPAMLEKCVALLDANPGIGIAYTDWQYFGLRHDICAAPEYDFHRLCHKGNLFVCAALMRREAWAKTGGFNPNMAMGLEDWDFWISCGEQGFFGKRIPEVLFYYRTKKTGVNIHAQRHFKELWCQIILNHPGLYEPEQVEKACTLLRRERNSRRNRITRFIHLFREALPRMLHLVKEGEFRKAVSHLRHSVKPS